MIIKLLNGDKIKMESEEKREARRKYKEYSLLSIGLKLKRNLNIASNFLKLGPNITNFGNAISALFSGFSPENPDVNKGDPPNVGIKDFTRIVKTAKVARELEKAVTSATKNGRLEVTSNYFNSPNNWYRVTETPEKFGILELGRNITTRDNSETVGTVDSWRRSIIKNYTAEDGSHFKIVPGTGDNEGYFIKTPDKHRFSLSKLGAAHGNTSQAAKGQIWGGTFAYSGKFPGGVLEGQAPTKIFRGMTETGADSRTNFILQDWDNVPLGARVGFHTGEMPMSNLGWFQRTKNGTYTYEPVIPEKRILILPTSKITKSKPYIRWSLKGYLNEAYNIEGGPGLKFLVVKDVDNPLPGVLNTKGNGEYSLHFHSTRDNPNKEEMFQALAESIPEGGKVSTWGTISKGGYHGINRFGELFGWPKVGERPTVNGPVNVFLKPTVSKDSKLDVIIFDKGYRTVPYPAYINHVWKVLKEKGIRTEPFDRSNTNEQTLMNFFNKGFTPVFKLYPGNNTKNQALETLRRMQNFGMDIDNTMGELPGYGKRSIRDLITLNSGRTSYVGYYDKPGILGSYFPNNGITTIDPGYKAGYNGDFIVRMASTMLHERNMHGTEKLLTPKMWKPYEDFISSIFKDIKVLNNGGKQVMTAIMQDGLEAPINVSSLLKHEARATLGELRKKIYDTKAYELAIKDNQQVKKGDIEKLRPYFEKAVDEMDKYELREELSKLNDYGRDYAAVGPSNSSTFFNDLRELLKIAPATIPFLIPRKEEKK